MVEVDFDKIAEISDTFIEYEGFLPLLIRCLIFRKWSSYLESIGRYDEVIQECINTMPIDFDEAVTELVNWCNENKEYSYLIK